MSAPRPGSGVPAGALPPSGEMLPTQGYVASLTVPNRVESVRPATAFLVQTARALTVPAASVPLFEVAVTEALTNAVKHGHDGEKHAVIVCQIEVTPGQLTMRIIDGGRGFVVPPTNVPNVGEDQPDALPESGYGLAIIQSVFPVVRTIRVDDRFGLELCLPLI